MKKTNPLDKRPELSTGSRIRIVIGATGITLGWMEYLNPSTPSGKWGALQEFFISMLGARNYAIALIVLGALMIVWSLVDFYIENRRASK